MMLLAAVSMGVPSAFSRYFAPEGVVRQEQLLNIGIAIMLLIAYCLYLWFSLKTHPGMFSSVEGATESHHEGEQWSTCARGRQPDRGVGAGGLDERNPSRGRRRNR